MTVTVYSTPTCPWCKKTKEWLEKNKIKYESRDVLSDHNAAKEMIQKSGQKGVPVTDIDGTIITGYNVEAMKKALKIQNIN